MDELLQQEVRKAFHRELNEWRSDLERIHANIRDALRAEGDAFERACAAYQKGVRGATIRPEDNETFLELADIRRTILHHIDDARELGSRNFRSHEERLEDAALDGMEVLYEVHDGFNVLARATNFDGQVRSAQRPQLGSRNNYAGLH